MEFLPYAAAYWLLCCFYFLVVQKTLFALRNHGASAAAITGTDIAGVYRHGVRSDAIVASFLTAIPLLISAVAGTIGGCTPLVPLTIYNAVAALAVGLATVADTVLYGFWGYKLDGSVLAYLRHPKGAFASVSPRYVAVALIGVIAAGAVFFFPAQWLSALFSHRNLLVSPHWWNYVANPTAAIITLALLFLCIRGTGIRPNNPSIAYFSPNTFLNHWALNPLYNFIYTLSSGNEFKNRFRYMDPAEARDITAGIFPATDAPPSRKLLNTNRPDILLIVMESFGSEFTRTLGSRENLTPNFDRLQAEGILFTDCVSASFRTDRGLTALLSGCPAQPTASIIRHTRKTIALPGLARSLRDHGGYRTTALHGGDLAIMHKSDYYLASGHSSLIAQRDFPGGVPTGKWGVHDGPVMERAFDILTGTRPDSRPLLVTLQTLSLHEPFDVPSRTHDNPLDNAVAYADRALGHLVDRLKATPEWENLLIVCVADHGFNHQMLPPDRREFARIPLLMLGGAVTAPARIDTLMCQTDLPAILLGQLGIDHHDFIFSRDILSPLYTSPSAIHIFQNGFMTVTPSGHTVYDTISDTILESRPDADTDRRVNMGKATVQQLYEYLDSL